MLDIPSVGGAASSALSAANVHPLVLFSILDHYARREGSQTRVIGEAPVAARRYTGSTRSARSALSVSLQARFLAP